MDVPFLETFSVSLDEALNNLIYLEMSLLIAGALDKVLLKALSTSNYPDSMIFLLWEMLAHQFPLFTRSRITLG